VVERIRVVPELDLQAQMCAQLNPDVCLHCGKCYMSCNDTGYQSITFDPATHLPEVLLRGVPGMVGLRRCT